MIVSQKDDRSGEDGGWVVEWNKENLCSRTENSIADDKNFQVVWIGGLTVHVLRRNSSNMLTNASAFTPHDKNSGLKSSGIHTSAGGREKLTNVLRKMS